MPIANWLGRQNPWALPRPPVWWLHALAERDAALCVLPGLTEPCYRIARRSGAMQAVRPVLGNDSETGRMCREGLVPVVTLRHGVTWNTDVFTWLDQHDTWAVGGPDKFVDQLEAQEADAAAVQQRATDDEADQRGSSAYFANLVRAGAVAFLSSAQSSSPPAPTMARAADDQETRTHGPLP